MANFNKQDWVVLTGEERSRAILSIKTIIDDIASTFPPKFTMRVNQLTDLMTKIDVAQDDFVDQIEFYQNKIEEISREVIADFQSKQPKQQQSNLIKIGGNNDD